MYRALIGRITACLPRLRNVNTINARLHLLGYVPNATNYTTDEWVDKFFSYTTTSGFLYKTNPADTVTLRVPPANDRQVNVNAVYTPIELLDVFVTARNVSSNHYALRGISGPALQEPRWFMAGLRARF